MKNERLAGILVLIIVGCAALIPLAVKGAFAARERVIELHARTPENGGWSLDAIRVRVGEPVTLRMTSDDVMHGFAIGKEDFEPLDILPGEFVERTLVFDQPGKYTFYCTHWCGENHWRMRGTIEVDGVSQPAQAEELPLFLKLGLDVDAPHMAETIPAQPPSAVRGERFASLFPPYALERETYMVTSPAQLWQQLRAEPGLEQLSDADIWDGVAWIWQSQSSPQAIAGGESLYTANCAACHGETGKGDGVFVRNLPAMDMQNMGHTPVRPPEFSDPHVLLGASPALLEGKIIRGGMGTGMPYWGPVFTLEQIDSIIRYLHTFAWQTPPEDSPAAEK